MTRALCTRTLCTRALVALAVGVASGMLAPASAQIGPFGALRQDARAEVRDIAVLGAGGAAAALPAPDRGFFYNPALLGRADLRRPVVTVVGLRAGAETDGFGKVDFFNTQLRPELDDGGLVRRDIQTLTSAEARRLEALYEETLRVFGDQTVIAADVTGPSVVVGVPAGPGSQLGIGVGVFASARARSQALRGGAGIPYLDVYGQADLVVPVTAGLSLARLPLSIGATVKYVDRRITARGGSLETFGDDDATLYVIHGSTVAVDLGVHAADVLGADSPSGQVFPGRLDLGLAVYDVAGGRFAFAQDNLLWDGSFSLQEPEGARPDDANQIAALIERFEARKPSPTVRAGLAYHLPTPSAGVLSGVAVALDYVSASTSEADQGLVSRLYGGVTARVGRVLAVRAGLGQGYPSVGVGLHTRALRLDYALFGVEDGRTPGQLDRYTHSVRLALGLF